MNETSLPPDSGILRQFQLVGSLRAPSTLKDMETAMAALTNPCASTFCPSAKASSGSRQSLGAHQTSFMLGSSASLKPCVSGRVATEEYHAKGGVVSVRAKGRRSLGMPGRQPNRQQMPAMPNMEGDDTPKFVLFIRTKNVPRWYPLSVVTGGTTAKLMVGAMKNDWGKKLYEGTLTRNIAGVIYKDERAVRATAIKQYPVLKAATGFEYGYKIMDPKNPKSAMFGTDVVTIPPQEELKSVVDKVKDFFGGVKDSFGSMSSLPATSQDQAAKASESKDKK